MTEFLDFPTAWRIQRTTKLVHHRRCSSVPGWHPLSGPAFLCDCGAVEREWEATRPRPEHEYDMVRHLCLTCGTSEIECRAKR